jgi:hypothetical protein
MSPALDLSVAWAIGPPLSGVPPKNDRVPALSMTSHQ